MRNRKWQRAGVLGIWSRKLYDLNDLIGNKLSCFLCYFVVGLSGIIKVL